MLIIFAGLPGVGKSTIARSCAQEFGGVLVRIDTIEQALRDLRPGVDIGPEGYVVGYGLARENLRLGRLVIADSVNPLLITRQAWRNCGSPWLDVEIVCSDLEEHRRRAESRIVDVPGLVPPDWDAILSREYEPWDIEPLRIDSAKMSISEAVEVIRRAI